MENEFFSCYLDKMTASLETYLKYFILNVSISVFSHFCFRTYVLPSSVANYSKDSPQFISALRSAATVNDCAAPHDPFDLQYRTRYIWDTLDLGCKALYMGLTYPDNSTLMQSECPPGNCLGTFCQEVCVCVCV